MAVFVFGNKTYQVGEEGFLLHFRDWDESFAEGMAPNVRISDGLSGRHWEIIRYIRNSFELEGKCPLIYKACKDNGLHLTELQKLFPTGYLRGACKLAGITYREGYLGHEAMPKVADEAAPPVEKTYEVDVRGFLVNADNWDEQFAVFKAHEMKMPGKLTDSHWRIISYLRESYKKDGFVPNVYSTCEANNIGLEQLERLFPDGYHRGAVKLAGLRAR